MTPRTAGGAAAPAPAPRPRAMPAWAARVDKVGVLIAALVAYAAFVLPFVTLRANRIAAGAELAPAAVFPALHAYALDALWAAGALFALVRSRAAWRAAVGVGLVFALGVAIGAAPAHLVTPDTPLARVSPAAGAWLLLFAFAVLIADALARIALAPAMRLVALAAASAALAAFIHGGFWDGLSVMQEYAVRADTFRNEAIRHLALVAGSVAAAVALGVPLGIGCTRSAALRGALLPLLNVVQTIPSIALYGLLMAPLAMGMTGRERLVAIELPLALPVVLSGVRIVLVQNIGLTAVAALIGGGGFGTFIFQGIGQSATDLVLLGALPTIALALVTAVLFEAATDLAKGARR
ncbi:ABC transporter permease subunit [Burkholderia pseudomallei]|uniref:ABC transporter permease subunit n=1 Tax=Burkholderia pseudomallei TaxID=28450 RepID=UPI0005727918|nr:ABC transporter permease subunit [Burkholderia pseudomallei]